MDDELECIETYYKRGQLFEQKWISGWIKEPGIEDNIILHRENDLPAKIRWSTDGTVNFKEWWWHGKMHRSTGPALIVYYPETHVKSGIWVTEWYLQGHEFSFNSWLYGCDLTDAEKVEMKLTYG